MHTTRCQFHRQALRIARPLVEDESFFLDSFCNHFLRSTFLVVPPDNALPIVVSLAVCFEVHVSWYNRVGIGYISGDVLVRFIFDDDGHRELYVVKDHEMNVQERN